MNLRHSCWTGIWLALLAPGLVLADEPKPPVSATQDVLFLNLNGQQEAAAAIAIVADEQAVGELTLLNDLQARVKESTEAEQGKYWIGLMCTAPSDAMRAQLDLPADGGLLVEEVRDGGAAKKSGFQPHDVLISATIPGKGQPEVRRLTSINDLISAVQATETGTMKLEFLRRGRKQSLDVVPEERPKPAVTEIRVTTNARENAIWSTTPHVGLRWAGPMILDVSRPPLPEGMTMDFQPAEGQPEKVTVKQGERTWEAEIKAIDKLPEEIRTLVQQQLVARNAAGKASFAYRVNAMHRPSLIVHGLHAALPPDVTVTTVRKGADPVKVTIQKGDQKWDVTEKDLGTLPVELRPIAEMALAGHHGPAHGPAPFTRAIAVPAIPPVPGLPAPAIEHLPHVRVVEPRHTVVRSVVPPTKVDSSNRGDIERQLKELAEQVERLRQAVEKSPPRQ